MSGKYRVDRGLALVLAVAFGAWVHAAPAAPPSSARTASHGTGPSFAVSFPAPRSRRTARRPRHPAAEPRLLARAAQSRRSERAARRVPTSSASTSRRPGARDRQSCSMIGPSAGRRASSRDAAPGRLLRAGRAESLRDVPSRRWARAEVAAGQGRGPAVGQEARQPVFEARQACTSTRRIRHDRPWRSIRKSAPIAPQAGHRVRPAHPHQERAAVEILGPRRLSRRARAACRKASTRTRNAHYPLMVFHGHLSGRHLGIPHHAAGSRI